MATAHPIAVSFSSAPALELKHILVTTDFSECSHIALKQAAAIARLHGSDLTLLHVVAPEPMIQNALEPASWEIDDVIHHARSEMETTEHADILAGIPHHLLVERGTLNGVIAQTISDRNISLLVVGTHGRGGIKKLLLGSVAEEIFRLAECPVMTIGPHESPSLLTLGRFQSILFATDFSPASTHALNWAYAFAQESKARLTVFHAVEDTSVTALYLHERLIADARKRLEDLVATLNATVPIEVQVVSGFAVEQILRMADEKKADLIVIGAHKSGIIGAHASAHLPWTVAQTVVGHAKCPVLTVRG